MQSVPITKIEILTDKEDGHPIYYCHSEDRDHDPTLTVKWSGEAVAILARQTLYKVKANPQTRNRVDIYMSLAEARLFGAALLSEAGNCSPAEWYVSRANPAAAARGKMRLPDIIWAKYQRSIRAGADVRSGTMSDIRNGYVNADFESPAETHIKMKTYEIHLGVMLAPPTGSFDENETVPVHVPEGEFQLSKREANPLMKVRGDFSVEMNRRVAAGLGVLLVDVKAPE